MLDEVHSRVGAREKECVSRLAWHFDGVDDFFQQGPCPSSVVKECALARKHLLRWREVMSVWKEVHRLRSHADWESSSRKGACVEAEWRRFVDILDTYVW